MTVDREHSAPLIEAPLIEAIGLTKHFVLKGPGLFGRRHGIVRALDGVDLAVKRGQTFSPEWGPHPWGWEPAAAPGPRLLP